MLYSFHFSWAQPLSEAAGKQMLEIHDLQTRNAELDEDTAEQDHEEIEGILYK